MKEGIGLRKKLLMVIATYPTILSVASIWRILLKTTHTEERSVHTNSES